MIQQSDDNRFLPRPAAFPIQKHQRAIVIRHRPQQTHQHLPHPRQCGADRQPIFGIVCFRQFKPRQIKVGQRVKSFETQRRHKNGAELNVSMSLSAIRGEDGQTVGVAAVGATAAHTQDVIDEVERFIWSFPNVHVLSATRSWMEID